MISSKQYFRNFIGGASIGTPHYLILVGSSDVSGNVRLLTRWLGVKNMTQTGFPSVFLGAMGNIRIAYGTTYAGSLTADILHAFCAAGIKKVFFLGNCGILTVNSIVRGERVRPWRIIDELGIAKVYSDKKIFLLRTNRKNVGIQKVSCLTWHNLFSEDINRAREWRKKGAEVVDLESSAVVSVCNKFKVACQIDLVAVDNVATGDRLDDIYHDFGRNINSIRISILREIHNAIMRG